RRLVENILTDNGRGGWGCPALKNIKMIVNHVEKCVYFDNVCHPIRFELDINDPIKEWESMFSTVNMEIVDFDSNLWNIAVQAHLKVHEVLMTNEFIRL
ncbi:unnamed protein product, partial [Rotaria magnacalcarata]